MKCPKCNHESSEVAPNFCSKCGHNLSSLSTKTATDMSQESQSSSNIPHGKTDIKPESEVLDYQDASVFRTQPNENVRKEKKPVSSVDSPVNAQHNQEQQNSDFAGDLKCNESDDPESQYVEPPNRNPASDQQISPSDRLTICFHAVLSKDFNFIPNKDFIFVRAGDQIGGWGKNLVELHVSGKLGEHGLLVEGKYVCKKTDAEAISIPYKYVVYKEKNQKYELDYEYIYKLDSKETTNRCLFVKSHLLNSEGEWHQYDDIICSKPSKDKLKRLKEYLWSEEKKKIIEGREIAGSIMLQTIFELLRSWSKINLSNFFCQLQQFYEVYGNPFVFEKTTVKWGSLEYGEKDVRNLLKIFMLEWVIPELQKEHKERNAFNMKPLNTALILLYVWKQYSLEFKLDSSTLSHICTALCLPKLHKEEFLSFWTDIMEPFSLINTLSDMVEALINFVRTEHKSDWIIVIPLLHLLKSTSKPFQPVFNQVNAQYEKNWAGLQGLKLENVKDRRAILNLMKKHDHLVEVDRLVARSWMYLMTLDELVECDSFIHAELLDILQLFTIKCPKEISKVISTSVLKILEHIQLHLVEQRYSCLNEDYRIQCIQAACKLLEVICKRVSHAFTDIPVACMNLVASVSGFAQTTQQTDTFSEKTHELLRYAKQTVRRWIGQSFQGRLINTSYHTAGSFTKEIEMWNNIVSIHFMSKDFTKEWRETFTRDFEGKYQKHCNVDRRCITYFNSLGETEWQCQAIAQHWSAFAASRGVKGEWDLKTTKHNLQADSVSCGIHTLAFATEFLKAGGFITSFQCPVIQQERMRLSSLLFESLDRTKKCGICAKNISGRKKMACTCGAVLHVLCAATPMCYICQEDSNPLAQISLPASDTAAHSADPDVLVETSGSDEGSALQQEEKVISMLEAIGKPVACCSEEEMEETKEEERHKHNGERHREHEGVQEKEKKVYKVLGRLTAQGKTYQVDEDELKRRVKGENMSTNMFRALIRVGKKDVPPNVLQQPKKAKTKVTIFSTLTEGEAEDLAKGFGMALTKHVPKDQLLSGIPEEDIPATLRTIEQMKLNVQNLGPESELDLATHRFGPTAADFFFSFLEDCMKKTQNP